MPKSHRPYPPEFRARLIELVRKGRTPEELGRQFEPSAQAIRNWVKQAALEAGQRTDGLTTEEREEMRRLRREVRQLFGTRCREAGARPSMGSVGDAYALCESFFATLECELLDRQRFSTQVDARLALFDFIEGWYNPRRRHSALDYRSPISVERAR